MTGKRIQVFQYSVIIVGGLAESESRVQQDIVYAQNVQHGDPTSKKTVDFHYHIVVFRGLEFGWFGGGAFHVPSGT